MGNRFITAGDFHYRRIGKPILVGGLEHLDHFSDHIGNVIIPTDFHSMIFQRGRLKPPTRSYFLVKKWLNSMGNDGFIPLVPSNSMDLGQRW